MGCEESPDRADPLEPLRKARCTSIRRHRQGRLREALAGYQAYLVRRPEDAAIWANLGALYRRLKRYQLAISSYCRALQLRPEDPGVLSNLGNALKDAQRLEEAVAIHRRAVSAEPANGRFRMNLAVALRDAGLHESALAELNLLLAADPDNPRYQWDKALNLLQLNRYLEAWPFYEARMRTGDLPHRAETCPRWTGQSLAGKRLLVYGEQGYGDTIMAARFLGPVKDRGGHITFECKAELHRLFRSLPVDALVAPRERVGGDLSGGGEFDYQIALMSLMGVLGTRPETVPPPAPLHVPPEAREKFTFLRQAAPGKTKIGIVWSGSLTFQGNEQRALPLEVFLEMTENPAIQLYSLQKGPREADLKASGAEPLVVDLAEQLDDFADTAAAIECLDEVRMTDSSVFHLAGSLGKPVVCLARRQVYWPYRNLARWYPGASVRTGCSAHGGVAW